MKEKEKEGASQLSSLILPKKWRTSHRKKRRFEPGERVGCMGNFKHWQCQ